MGNNKGWGVLVLKPDMGVHEACFRRGVERGGGGGKGLRSKGLCTQKGPKVFSCEQKPIAFAKAPQRGTLVICSPATPQFVCQVM